MGDGGGDDDGEALMAETGQVRDLSDLSGYKSSGSNA